MTRRDTGRRATPRPDIDDPMPPGARSEKRRAIRDLVAKTEKRAPAEDVRGGGTGGTSQEQTQSSRPPGPRSRGRENHAGRAVYG